MSGFFDATAKPVRNFISIRVSVRIFESDIAFIDFVAKSAVLVFGEAAVPIAWASCAILNAIDQGRKDGGFGVAIFTPFGQNTPVSCPTWSISG